MKREQRGESREERDYNLLSNLLWFFTELLPPLSSLLSLLGMTKKECHCEHLKGAWQSHFDYNRKAVIARQRSCRGNPIICYSQMFKCDSSSLRSSGNTSLLV